MAPERVARHGLRMLRKNPGFTIVVVLTLALGIGANTAIFSVVNAVLLRPLPYPDAGRIAGVGLLTNNLRPGDVTVPQLNFICEHGTGLFNAIAGYRGGGTFQLKQQNKVDWVSSLRVTYDFFRALDISPAIGHGIAREETQPGGSRSVVLSDDLWRRMFDADPGIIGTQIKLDDKSYTIAGVLPHDFTFIEQPVEVFIPLQLGNNLSDQGTNTRVIARLKPGVTFAQAQSELKLLYPQLPDRGGKQGLVAVSYQRALAGDVRPSLLVLFGAVGLLLLIACANVASLLLARANTRAREMSIRMAIGASRSRLLRQFLAESLVIALVGAAAGLLSAFWALGSLVSSIPWNLPLQAGSIAIDSHVLLFTLGIAILTSIIFGLAAFWQTTRMTLVDALKEGGRHGRGAAHGRIRNVLVIGEVALSLTLLIGAALLAETLYNLRSEKLGFDPANVITMTTPGPQVKPLTIARVWGFEKQLLDRIQSLPGVSSAAVVSVAPLTGQGNLPTQVEGYNDSSHSFGGTEVRAVSSRYFETLRIPILQGRGIRESDAAGALPIAVINERLARLWWKDKVPIGDRLVIGEYQGREYLDPPDPPREVIGVVADVKGMLLNTPAPPTVYYPAPQAGVLMNGSTAWVIRTSSNVDIGPEIRRAAAEIDPDQRVMSLRSMSAVIGKSVAGQSFDALLLGLFAGVALALAAVGIYGVLSLYVNQRTHEIGIRMALGAEPRQVLRLVVGQGLLLALAGVVIGLGAALGLMRFLRELLYGVRATSIAPYAIGSMLLICVALLACYIPARRARRIDPLTALRHE